MLKLALSLSLVSVERSNIDCSVDAELSLETSNWSPAHGYGTVTGIMNGYCLCCIALAPTLANS